MTALGLEDSYLIKEVTLHRTLKNGKIELAEKTERHGRGKIAGQRFRPYLGK